MRMSRSPKTSQAGLESKRYKNMKGEEPRIKTDWRRTDGKPSSAFKNLWNKLVAKRDKPAKTHQDEGGQSQ